MVSLRRHIIRLILLAVFLPLNAATMDELRRALDKTSDPSERYNIYLDIYKACQQTDSIALQIACVNDIIDLCHQHGMHAREANAIGNRIALFYNHGMDDSVAVHVPQDKEVLSKLGEWDKYYEIWTTLANSYLYSGKPNQALREAQGIFDDAKKRNHQLGMGVAYYTMGSIYTTLNVLDESVSAYKKGLDIMSAIKPLPTTLTDLYPYYGDVLNLMQDYEGLEQLTVRWEQFLQEIISQRKFSPTTIDNLYSYYYIACAQAAIGLRQFKKADKMLAEARSRIYSMEDYAGGNWLYYMARLRFLEGKYPDALDYNTRRYKMTNVEEDAPVYIDVIKQRADIMMKLGRYQEAADFYYQAYVINDSTNVQDTKRQLNEMNTLFRVDELEREQEHLKMEQERAQFRYTMLIGGIILLALIIFSVFRYIAAKRLKVAHDNLQKTHDELLTAYDQLEETTTAKERIESDLRIARNIQMGMVPRTFPDRPDLDLFASMTPAKEVGGDLYGYLLTDDKLYFCLGDVSGKGVPASLFMAQATRLFRTLAAQGLMPDQICTQINEALSGEDNETSMFVTMFLGLLDLQTGHLDFCNAGHNPPVIVGEQATFVEMVPNAPIGLWPGLEYQGEEIADISNKPFFVYSDGLNEAENRQQEQFSDERLLEVLQTTPFESSRQTIELLRELVEQHRDGAEPNDDLTMLCVKVIRTNEE